MRLTQHVTDLADRFFDQLYAAGASEGLIVDLAMTLARHADRSAIVIPFPPWAERTARRARR
jgi:hypothetical protein